MTVPPARLRRRRPYGFVQTAIFSQKGRLCQKISGGWAMICVGQACAGRKGSWIAAAEYRVPLRKGSRQDGEFRCQQLPRWMSASPLALRGVDYRYVVGVGGGDEGVYTYPVRPSWLICHQSPVPGAIIMDHACCSVFPCAAGAFSRLRKSAEKSYQSRGSVVYEIQGEVCAGRRLGGAGVVGGGGLKDTTNR